jgi:hypothetical protein
MAKMGSITVITGSNGDVRPKALHQVQLIMQDTSIIHQRISLLHCNRIS